MLTNIKHGKIDLSCIADGGFKPYKDGKIWSDELNRAFKTYREIFIPAGRYYVDRSLIVPSDTKIYADEHAEIVLTKGTGKRDRRFRL